MELAAGITGLVAETTASGIDPADEWAGLGTPSDQDADGGHDDRPRGMPVVAARTTARKASASIANVMWAYQPGGCLKTR